MACIWNIPTIITSFQLFVSMDLYNCYDFCVYMPEGTEVERIWLDTEWYEKSITELDSYDDAYYTYILPEILCPLQKPLYVL